MYKNSCRAFLSFVQALLIISLQRNKPRSEVMAATSGSRVYTEVSPHYQWVRGEEFDTLLVDVSGMISLFICMEDLTLFITLSSINFNHNTYFLIRGIYTWDKEFKKEQLKVRADTEGNLIISGEHQVEGNRWRRFLKSFQLPKDCNAKMIKAKLDEGILYVVVPKPTAEDHPSQQSKEHAYKEQDVDETREGPQKNRQWILNILVAIIVVAGLGTYVGYKLSHKRDT